MVRTTVATSSQCLVTATSFRWRSDDRIKRGLFLVAAVRGIVVTADRRCVREDPQCTVGCDVDALAHRFSSVDGAQLARHRYRLHPRAGITRWQRTTDHFPVRQSLVFSYTKLHRRFVLFDSRTGHNFASLGYFPTNRLPAACMRKYQYLYDKSIGPLR